VPTLSDKEWGGGGGDRLRKIVAAKNQ
jgi:hypothetical protein